MFDDGCMQRRFQSPQGSVVPSHETVGSQDSKRIFFTTEASIAHGPNRSPTQVTDAAIRVVKELTCDVNGHAVKVKSLRLKSSLSECPSSPVQVFAVPVERFCTQRGDLKMAIVSFDQTVPKSTPVGMARSPKRVSKRSGVQVVQRSTSVEGVPNHASHTTSYQPDAFTFLCYRFKDGQKVVVEVASQRTN